MTDKTILRTGRDRLRYTITFELTLLAMLIPAGSAFFDRSMAEIGGLGVILSAKAMALNLLYNWLFDLVDARAGRVSSERSHLGRLVHALGFEATLMMTSLPLFMWWLKIGLVEALLTDITVASLVVVYTYVFTLVYDRVFPLVRARPARS